MYVCLYVYYIDSLKSCKFFFKGSFLLHTLYYYRYRLNNRCQPVPVRFSRPELVAPHLE